MNVTADMNIKVITFYAVLTVLIVVLLIAGVQALYYQAAREETFRKLQGAHTPARMAKHEQIEQISRYRRVEGQSDKAKVPIDRAIELFVERQQQGQSPQAETEAESG